MILKENDKVMLIACSNELPISYSKHIREITKILNNFGLDVVLSYALYREANKCSEGLKRAQALMDGFKDSSIKCIFDVSGGDLCNEILPYLDFDLINKAKAMYYGYSDLSVLLNSLYKKANKKAYYYNIKTILTDEGKQNFYNTFIKENSSYNLFKSWKYKWICGNKITGEVLGGNIRCTLKLSGTDYMPSFKNKTLFLESNSGDIIKIRTFVAQYRELGIFNDINGIILGEFTEIDLNNEEDELIELFKDICIEFNLSLIRTKEIGHSNSSKGILIGSYINLNKPME
ncbi:LD-carboxypeptidase, partial [Clostridium baratii]